MEHKNSQSASYAAAGVDITAGYKAVELMKKHVARTRNEGCLDDVGGFGGCFGRAMTLSPTFMRELSMIFFLSTMPTLKPARS